MAAAIGTVESNLDHITSEVDLFSPPLHTHCVLNAGDREYLPVASHQHGAPIEFMVKGADGQYLDLNNSRLVIRAKITKADGANIADDTAGPVNLPLHSMFREIQVELGGKTVSDPNHLYPYRAYIETALGYSKATQKTRLLAEGWVKDTEGKLGERVVADNGENAGLVARAKMWKNSKVVELVGRPHVDLFHQNRLIPPGIDLHMKLIPASDAFAIISAAPAGNAAQEQYKMEIVYAALVIHTKQLTSHLELAHRRLHEAKPMLLPYARVQVKHLSIPQNQTAYSFENVFAGAQLPDLVVVGFLDDVDFGGTYGTNPLRFQNFSINRVELRRNGMLVPRYGYTPNFTNGQYIKDYVTLLTQLGCDKGDRCIDLTPSEWANGFTLYAFKVTDGDIGSGTETPRSPAASGSLRLEVGFSAAQATNIKVIVLSQSQGELDVDQYKNPTVS